MDCLGWMAVASGSSSAAGLVDSVGDASATVVAVGNSSAAKFGDEQEMLLQDPVLQSAGGDASVTTVASGSSSAAGPVVSDPHLLFHG